MKKKYFILAFTFLCLLMAQNSFGQQNGSGDYDNQDPCDSDSSDFDPDDPDCDNGYCNSSSINYNPELCNNGGDPCDFMSDAYDPVECANSGGGGDPCDFMSNAYDPVKCANSGGGGNTCDPSSNNYDPWTCNSGGGGGDPCDEFSEAYDPFLCQFGDNDVCDITSNAYDPIACAMNSGNPCDPFSENYDPYAPECNTPPDSGSVCDETSASYDYIACNYPGGTGGGSNGGSGTGSGSVNVNTVYSETTSNIIPYNFEPDKNNIFNANGRALRSGATGSLLQIEINGVLYKPSQLIRTDGTIAALNKIATFYAQSKGYSGIVQTVNTIGNQQGNDVAKYGNGVITIRSIAFSAGKFDNVNNFKSVLNHEILHWKDPRNNAQDYNFMDHANIYLLSASDPDFKDTTIDFKISQTNEFMLRMLNGVGMNSTRILEEITKYNDSNTGGVKISNPFYLGSLTGFTFTTSIDGVEYANQFSYKVLENPNL